MRIGIHTSSAGSIERAAIKAHELGANCFQIFSASPRAWAAADPNPAAVERLAAVRKEHDLRPMVIHTNYLINLCSVDPVNRPKSVAAFRGEVTRALTIGADYLVVHPGSLRSGTLEDAIVAFSENLAEACAGLSSRKLDILFENTAGQGGALGTRLEQLAEMRAAAKKKVKFALGYCLDTCHAYAAGFDIAKPKGLEDFIVHAEKLLGLKNVPVIHTNDSKGALNSHLDRHANIGEGYIGLKGFRSILNHPALREKAFILETPIDKEGDDQRNVDTLWSLCPSSSHPRNARKKL